MLARHPERLGRPHVGRPTSRSWPATPTTPSGARAARRHGRRLLPAALAHGRRRASRSSSGVSRALSPRRRARPEVGRIVYLGGAAARRRRSSRCPSTCAAVREVEPDPPLRRRTDDRAARRGHHRQRLGELRDDPLPHRAPAGDGDAALGAHPDPADRDPRRPLLPRARRRPAAGRSTARSTSAAPTSSTYEEMMHGYARAAGPAQAHRRGASRSSRRGSRAAGSDWSPRCPSLGREPLVDEPHR